MSNREDLILAKARILVAINNGASDETIYDYSEAFEENRVNELVNLVKSSNLDHKIRFFSEFLVEKHPEKKQYLLITSIRLASSWENKSQTEDLIIQYKNELGEDFDIVIERLNYYLKYNPKNIETISELLTKAEAFQEVTE